MPLTTTRVEEALDLTVLDRLDECGVTELGKEFFTNHRRMIGPVAKVVLAYITDPSWEYVTYVVDEHDYALAIDGFSWGYFGTGPAGLRWLFGQLGWTVDPASLPPSNVEGVWVVSPDGSVVSCQLDGSS